MGGGVVEQGFDDAPSDGGLRGGFMKHQTLLPDPQLVDEVRAVFVAHGGDLDNPGVLPRGIWKAMESVTRNTRWPRYLYPDMDPYVDWVVVDRALDGDQASLD